MENRHEGTSASEELGLLSSVVHDSDGVAETAEAVVEFALKAVGCTAAVIAVDQRNGKLGAVAVSNLAARELIDGQRDPGPVREAYGDGNAVLINDTRTDQRWPDWSATAERLGYRSLIVVRLTLGENPVGGLILCHDDPAAFDRDDAAVAHIVARHASIALATARKQESLAEAVDARKLVGQAMGILMERYQIGDEQAFAILRRYSQDTNVKLREIARELVTTRRLPEHPRPPESVDRENRPVAQPVD